MQAGSFAEIRSHTRRSEEDSDVAPPEAPETFGEYKKSEKSAGVIGLMDMMIKDLESDVKDAEYEEKTSQSDYSKLMEESQATRAANSKSITQKSVTKAEMETKLGGLKDVKTATDEDLSLVGTTLMDLHAACDFLPQIRRASP